MDREEMSRIWQSGGVTYSGALCIWHSNGTCERGTPRTPTPGEGANAFMRRVTKHYGPPPPASAGKLKVPDWLRERWKQNCPRNYKDLVRLYGRLDEIDYKLAAK